MKLASIILAVVLVGTTAARAEMVDFKSDEHRFTIKHPAEWKPVEATQAAVVARFVTPLEGESDKYQEEFSIKIIEMNTQADVNELVDSIKPGMAQQLAGYVEKTDDKLTLAGLPARRVVSEVATQFSPIRSTQWFVVDGTRLLIITLNTTPATAEQYKPYGDAMIESLTIVKE